MGNGGFCLTFDAFLTVFSKNLVQQFALCSGSLCRKTCLIALPSCLPSFNSLLHCKVENKEIFFVLCQVQCIAVIQLLRYLDTSVFSFPFERSQYQLLKFLKRKCIFYLISAKGAAAAAMKHSEGREHWKCFTKQAKHKE